jgi:ATP-dependent Clp protease ATP-binding subunit ClpA
MHRHPEPERILRLTRLEPFLNQRLFGQEEAVATLAEAVLNAELGLPRPGKPKAAFLFLGPTGVGKTQLTKLLAQFLYGEREAAQRLERLNMAEYADERTALGRLIGENHGEQGDLGDALDRLIGLGGGILLVDEIEKAAPKVAKLWLAGIDEAEIGCANGSRKNLDGCYIVMTSNLGAQEAMDMQDSGQTAMKNVLREKATKFFGPEMIGRFRRYNGVVVFNPLSASVQEQVCRSILEREVERFADERGLQITATKHAFLELKKEGFEKAMGARPMEGTVQRLMNRAYCALLVECARAGQPVPEAVVLDRETSLDAQERKKFTLTMRSSVTPGHPSQSAA